ncbi:MAG TPA: Ig-like domain-containing protein, partial [Verrucomicrobiae bacterium]|nr:Ig-like domain-containing protein [Verrucomicrobiae bacterium]
MREAQPFGTIEWFERRNGTGVEHQRKARMKPAGANHLLTRFFLVIGLLAAPLAGLAQSPWPYSTNPIPVVTIYATDPLASEAGKTGAFTVYRTGPATNSLTVFYSIAGNSSNGVDYVTLSHTVSFPAGEHSAQIQIVPIDDSLNDTNGAPEPESVVLRLTQPPYLIPAMYLVGEPDEAEVFILEHTETNIPPVVRIVAPPDGAKFYANANVQICASAFDLDGFVTSVEFFENGNSLGVVTNYPIFLADTPINGFPPYHSLCLVWSNAPPGDYTLTAVATDNGGATGTSGPVSITVLTNLPPPQTNLPPTMTIVAPQNGATFYSGANIRICADADDVDGFVTSVEFFENGTSLGVVTNPPILYSGISDIFEPLDRLFCLTWSNAPPGAYALTAVATDNGG